MSYLKLKKDNGPSMESRSRDLFYTKYLQIEYELCVILIYTYLFLTMLNNLTCYYL